MRDWNGGICEGSNFVDIDIQDFTVKVWVSSGGQIKIPYTFVYSGLSISHPLWILDVSGTSTTKPIAYFVIQPPGETVSRRFWFTDMSIGATSWSYIFDDGLQTIAAVAGTEIIRKPDRIMSGNKFPVPEELTEPPTCLLKRGRRPYYAAGEVSIFQTPVTMLLLD